MNNTFTFQGHTFNYFDHPHNNTKINERAVELPLVKYFLDKYPDCVEIGAVSPYYFDGTHEIYDLTDDHPRSKKINAKDVNVGMKNILSCSTIEHCGVRDGFNSIEDIELAPALLDYWVNESDKYLITWPAGYCKWLDIHASENYDCKFIVRRPFPSHEWKEVSPEELNTNDLVYGNFSCANGVIILENVF